MIDLEKPMHFTKEQSEWIKAYVIAKKKEARADAIDVYKEMVLAAISDAINRGEEKVVLCVFLDKVAKQLKGEEE